jgi:hypothetical protein
MRSRTPRALKMRPPVKAFGELDWFIKRHFKDGRCVPGNKASESCSPLELVVRHSEAPATMKNLLAASSFALKGGSPQQIILWRSHPSHRPPGLSGGLDAIHKLNCRPGSTSANGKVKSTGFLFVPWMIPGPLVSCCCVMHVTAQCKAQLRAVLPMPVLRDVTESS